MSFKKLMNSLFKKYCIIIIPYLPEQRWVQWRSEQCLYLKPAKVVHEPEPHSSGQPKFNIFRKK